MPPSADLSTSTLRFYGKDAKECNEFVESVINHAFSEGKSRDDEWIADFVATRMTGDALRWWSGLDDETQQSWKKLRRAMFKKYRPKFSGTDGEDAVEFVQSARQAAEDAGREADNTWIVRFVSNSLAGDALRWYLSLASNAQEDWKLLQVAILARYSVEGESQDFSSRVPTPASAAPMPPKFKKGRIRVRRRDNPTSFKMHVLTSQIDSQTKKFSLSTAESEALIVEYDPSITGVQPLRIPDDQIPGFDILVGGWESCDLDEAYVNIMAMNSKSSTLLHTIGTGPIIQSMWIISSPRSKDEKLLSLNAHHEDVSLIPRTFKSREQHILFHTIPIVADVPLELFLEPI